jgi:hypothetical protein
MNIFSRFLKRRRKKPEPGDNLEHARMIEPLINELVTDIFINYREQLMDEAATYIVPAIWGAKQDGQLDSAQKEIYRKAVPVIEGIFNSLNLKDLSASQAFAIRFLIRGLIISRVIYTVEMAKNHMVSGVDGQNKELQNMEPMGNA